MVNITNAHGKRPNYIPRRKLTSWAIIGLCLAATLSPFIGQAAADVQTPGKAGPIADTVAVQLAIPDFSSINALDADKSNLALNSGFSTIRIAISRQIRRPSLTPQCKTILYQLAGTFQVYDAMDILINDIDFKDPAWPHSLPGANAAIPADWATPQYPAQSSLSELGSNATKSLITTITGGTPQVPFVAANADGYAAALDAIEGKKYAVLHLRDGAGDHASPKVQAQCNLVIAALNKYVN